MSRIDFMLLLEIRQKFRANTMVFLFLIISKLVIAKVMFVKKRGCFLVFSCWKEDTFYEPARLTTQRQKIRNLQDFRDVDKPKMLTVSVIIWSVELRNDTNEPYMYF